MTTSLSLMAQNLTGPCEKQGPYHIVILGSSTAAGSGASTPDSAWVNRYRTFLQALNPSNQVTNLAVGGYNTYRIMPTGFQVPAGRPSPDTLRNISAAVALNPDAIILNLPSNDVALGFSLNEQTFNMDSIYATALQAGIPIWICTTQPRNFNPTNLQLQAQMRDTIIAHFSPYVLDFWTGLALTNNSLDPFYDSGDGVHLNDKGHRLLFQRARDENLPNYLFQAPPYTDVVVSEMIYKNQHPCGDSAARFEVFWANIGSVLSNDTFQLFFEVLKTGSGIVFTDSIDILGTKTTCLLDSFEFTFNNSIQGEYHIRAFLEIAVDTTESNDSIIQEIYSLGRPNIQVINDTLCHPGSSQLMAISDAIDTILWYSNQNATNPISGGNSVMINQINSDTMLFAQSVRGPLYFSESLFTTAISNIDWNGTMFDIIASDTLSLDSLALKIANIGFQGVEMYIKSGSYLGFELDSLPWLLWTIDTIQVNSTSDLLVLNMPEIQMLPNDTIGVYLQMENPSSRLSYHSLSNPNSRTNGPLTVNTGSGISHDFSAIFYPRDWNGEIYFHYGFNPEGTCATDRVPALIEFSDQNLYLGFEDSTISLNTIIELFLPPGFQNPQWSNGSNGNSLTINALDLGQGTHQISLKAFDSIMCEKTDTVNIHVIVNSLKEFNAEEKFHVFPNPGNCKIYIEGNKVIEMVEIRDVYGKIHISISEPVSNSIMIENLSEGIYFINIHSNGLMESHKWLKEH